MEKRGQGLSTNAIILIILGVVVLVALIFGFTLGFDKIAPFIKTNNNVATIVTSCDFACNANAKFDFCSVKRDLKTEDITLKDVTCSYLATEQNKYGVSICGAVKCDEIISEEITEDKAKESCEEGKIVQYLESNTLKSYTCKPEDTLTGSTGVVGST